MRSAARPGGSPSPSEEERAGGGGGGGAAAAEEEGDGAEVAGAAAPLARCSSSSFACLFSRDTSSSSSAKKIGKPRCSISSTYAVGFVAEEGGAVAVVGFVDDDKGEVRVSAASIGNDEVISETKKRRFEAFTGLCPFSRTGGDESASFSVHVRKKRRVGSETKCIHEARGRVNGDQARWVSSSIERRTGKMNSRGEQSKLGKRKREQLLREKERETHSTFSLLNSLAIFCYLPRASRERHCGSPLLG